VLKTPVWKQSSENQYALFTAPTTALEATSYPVIPGAFFPGEILWKECESNNLLPHSSKVFNTSGIILKHMNAFILSLFNKKYL
jgi:hypothetical protein